MKFPEGCLVEVMIGRLRRLSVSRELLLVLVCELTGEVRREVKGRDEVSIMNRLAGRAF